MNYEHCVISFESVPQCAIHLMDYNSTLSLLNLKQDSYVNVF